MTYLVVIATTKVFQKKSHFYTNRKGIKNVLKIIYTPYAQNQYFKSYNHFCILKIPGLTYTNKGKNFLLKHIVKRF